MWTVFLFFLVIDAGATGARTNAIHHTLHFRRTCESVLSLCFPLFLVIVIRHSGFAYDQHSTPVFTFGASDPKLTNRQKYGTLIRVGSTFKGLGLALITVGSKIPHFISIGSRR